MELLRPQPHRGDLVAAGAVPLAVAVLMINVRLDHPWGNGVFLLLDAVAAALLLGMGLSADPEARATDAAGPPRPRPYVAVLLVAGLLLALVAEYRLAQVFLGSGNGSSGTGVWVGLLFTLGTVALWRARDVAVLILIASIAGGITALFFVDWVFSPSGIESFRWIGLLLIVAFTVLHLATREQRRREGVLFVVAGGLTAFVLTYTLIAAIVSPLALATGGSGAGKLPVGWALVSVVAGFALVAFAALEREPAPGYLGVFVLATFAAVAGAPASDGPSLVGWPLFLLVVGLGGLAFALRPSRPLPPAPPGPAGAEAGETVAMPPRPAPPPGGSTPPPGP
ncbi:MAG TPA: hypothetical protein VGI54_01300 [Solirubrobacteraceae bacterium]|jgi:hypothetical protein